MPTVGRPYFVSSVTACVATDGEQALQFLRRTGPFADAPRPGMILLDVNLPRLSGLEVLAELKQDPRHITELRLN